LVMSNNVQKVSDSGTGLDSVLLENRTPLIISNFEIIPSGSNHFKKSDKVVIYTQIYDPIVLAPNPPGVRIGYRIMDLKTGKQAMASGAIDATPYITKGSPVIAMGLKVPFDDVPPGSYRLDVQAGDLGGAKSTVRSVNFDVE
jgi:hypothetical protein